MIPFFLEASQVVEQSNEVNAHPMIVPVGHERFSVSTEMKEVFPVF